MWPFTRKKTPARRKEIRRTKASRRVAWYRRLPAFGSWTSTLTVLAAVFAAIVVNIGGPTLAYRVGESTPRAITSRVSFQIMDRLETRVQKRRASESAPNYYRLDEPLIEDVRARLLNLMAIARASSQDVQRLTREARDNGLTLTEEGARELLRIAESPDDLRNYESSINSLMRVLKNKPIVPSAEVGSANALQAKLFDPSEARERSVARNQLIYANNPEDVRKSLDDAVGTIVFPPLRQSIEQSLARMLSTKADGDEARPFKPLYRFDAEATARAAEAAADAVPEQFSNYAEGEILADAGPISREELELLRAEHARYHKLALSRAEGRIGAWLAILGRALLTVIVVLGLSLFVTRQARRPLRSPLRLGVSVAVLLISLFLARMIQVFHLGPPELALLPQAFAAGLLGIVYGYGPVFAIAAGLGVVNTLAVEQDVSFLITLLAASGTLIYGLRDVRNRGKIVLVGFFAGLVAAATAFAAAMLDAQTLTYSLTVSIWAGVATLLAAFVVEGILPGIERLFGFSTSMTLLEWCDASKPLLRMMAADAPGTYNHSLLVGALAESAAEAIGANGLLCRAGAYYHDIGKINKPEYFVENQTSGLNRHDRLSPAMSLLIIVGHVKDGVEMAKEYSLPASLRPFIAEHHGTTLVEYFYHAARTQQKHGDPEVSDTEFRYPGPKPQTRETAICMLCDGVEGAVRAMTEPTPNRIETVVEDIIHKRLMDGQFDACDLTFRELEIIEKSLVKSLCGLYHARIVYPEDESRSKSEARQPQTAS